MLRDESARKALKAFIEVSAQSWRLCESDPAAAVRAVMEGRRALGYPEEEKGVIDENSAEFQRLSLIRCLPYVTGQGESHHIDPQTWQKASVAMTSLGFV